MATTDKLLVRVLEAVARGYDTSSEIALRLGIRRAVVARRLLDLVRCDCVRRQRVPPVNGRPEYRYRVVARNSEVVARG